MGWVSMGVGMAVSNARYKKRQREAEERRRRANKNGLEDALIVGAVAGTIYGLNKLADAGDALKPVNEQISRDLTETHASTWATLGFFGTAFYHAGTRPVETANPSLYEIGTVIAITVLGYLVGWLIDKWVGEPGTSTSECEAEMLLLVGEENVTHDTQDTVDKGWVSV